MQLTLDLWSSNLSQQQYQQQLHSAVGRLGFQLSSLVLCMQSCFNWRSCLWPCADFWLHPFPRLPYQRSSLSMIWRGKFFQSFFYFFWEIINIPSIRNRCHIAIGYTFAFLLLVTIVVFLIFFGTICNAGDQSFCKKVRFQCSAFWKGSLFLIHSKFVNPIVFHGNYDYWILHLYYFHDRCIHIIPSLQNQVPHFLCCPSYCLHRIHTYHYAYHRCCREKARRQIADL